MKSMIAAALALAASPAAGADLAPLRRDYGDRLVATAYVNGVGPMDFLIDTGATTDVVFDNIRARIALPEPSGAAAVISFAGLKAAPRVLLDRIDVGSAQRESVSAVLLGDWEMFARTPQGVLGLDFLKETTVLIDAAAGRLSALDADGMRKADATWIETTLRPTTFGLVDEPLLLADVRIDGAPAEALLDTGAESSVCNLAAIRKLKTVPPVRAIEREVADAHGGVLKSYQLSVSRFEIGDLSFDGASILVSDAPFFESIGYRERPFCVLGLDFLARQPFAVDRRGLRLIFQVSRGDAPRVRNR
ncbi:MAG: retropepsin-like aspartic protease [Parvularculaceae bacterium]|nr:retropepsin-like aspartic protease [Parvularculaceae bacterium]